MKQKRTTTIFLLLSGMLVFQACTLEDPGPSNPTAPLTLQAEQDLSLTKLTWSQVKVTGFKEYIILQSTTEIPNTPTPEVTANVSILKRIDDADVTTLLTSDILFTTDICYKVYASVDDRFIQSPNVCIKQDFDLFNGFYDRAAHEKGVDEIALFDRINQHFSAYNYKEGNITNTVTEIFLSFPVMEMSTWQGTTNVFAYDQSPGRLYKYRFPELTISSEKHFGNVLFAVKPHNQFVIVAVEDFNKSFQVLSRTNLTVLDSKAGLMGNRNIATFDGDPFTVLDITDNEIHRYSINENGKITFLESKTPGVSQPTTQNATASGTNFFITGRFGNILDRNGNIVASLANNLNENVLMTRFSHDESRVVYAVSNNVNVRLEVADISNPQNITILGSYTIPSANFSDLIVDEDIIYLMGVTFGSGQGQTFILKYPML